MPVIREKIITREMVKANPEWIFVFGDNFTEKGLGGQAGAMRGEPNSYGIATKHAPGMQPADFFYDNEYHKIIPYLNLKFKKLEEYVLEGKTVVIPTDGIGTGLAKLPETAPNIHKFIVTWIEFLENISTKDNK